MASSLGAKLLTVVVYPGPLLALSVSLPIFQTDKLLELPRSKTGPNPPDNPSLVALSCKNCLRVCLSGIISSKFYPIVNLVASNRIVRRLLGLFFISYFSKDHSASWHLQDTGYIYFNSLTY